MKPPPLVPTYLTSHQAAGLLQVTRATVTEYLRRGWLTGQRIGRAWRVDPRSMERLLAFGPSPSRPHFPSAGEMGPAHND